MVGGGADCRKVGGAGLQLTERILFHYLEPTHERALSNLAYFESLRTKSPSEFVDKVEVEKRTTGSGRIGASETERYEATCREGRPLVRSGCGLGGAG